MINFNQKVKYFEKFLTIKKKSDVRAFQKNFTRAFSTKKTTRFCKIYLILKKFRNLRKIGIKIELKPKASQ